MSLLLTAKVRLLGLGYSLKDSVTKVGRSVRDVWRDSWDRGEEMKSPKNEQMSNGEWKKTKWQLTRLSATVCGIEFCYAAETGKIYRRCYMLLLTKIVLTMLLLL